MFRSFFSSEMRSQMILFLVFGIVLFVVKIENSTPGEAPAAVWKSFSKNDLLSDKNLLGFPFPLL